MMYTAMCTCLFNFYRAPTIQFMFTENAKYTQNLKKLYLHPTNTQFCLIKLSCNDSFVHIAFVRVFSFSVECWPVRRCL